ncbi:tRNA dihydrouridine(20/20a) synthase DusA [Kiloniella laminariae]|uniref:tRNA-dihydrouridine(20/20a) synthase n=1 Tax=Kiloniella laminariae TaxID=454162 RepID=A0ABT4LII3_9PROT|nr:tRNA dihydrouridine(20/20a) synthase DusA [Kiloniella laminariae]MCZ4280896.1 tRNA dihydrouridine(20/20a) synthase DusA [Kiloniella laminariae]
MNRKVCVAPMLDWTDRHERSFLRMISRHTVLYTEMITTGALLHGKDPERFLRFDEQEHPVALQLGGSDPEAIAVCAGMAADYGYDEVNLNVGCPSDRVQKGRFGACLMAEPELVAESVAAMRQSGLPATVKTRIGIDDQDSYEFLHSFVGTLDKAGCKTLIVHARKAWLEGLSPKQNREIPPLRYDVVYQIKQDFPELEIILNGGVQDLDAAESHMTQVDGVMIGREAYQNPYVLAEVDRRFYGEGAVKTREEIVSELTDYAARQVAEGVPVKSITRHVLGLFNGLPGARAWRRSLSQNAFKPGATEQVIRNAYADFLGAGEARQVA